jgi:hypothetical protein
MSDQSRFSVSCVLYLLFCEMNVNHDDTKSTKDDESAFLKSGHHFSDNHAQPIRTGHRRPISLRLSGALRFAVVFSWTTGAPGT